MRHGGVGRSNSVATPSSSFVDGGVLDDGQLLAALGHGQFNTATQVQRLPLQGQRLGDQLGFRHFVVEQHQRRRWFVVIELCEEGRHHLRRLLRLGMRGIEGAVAVVAAAPDEEHLNAGATGNLVACDDVGILDGSRIDHAAALDIGQPANTIPQRGRAFEFKRFGGLLHLMGERLLHLPRFACQEAACLIDQLGIIRLAHPSDARGRAAFDLEQQARTGAVAEHAVIA